MSRAHLRGVALINWKGCFFQHYELDRHVTALEGANGAGKTTVMIGVYVALLPDLSLLSFANASDREGRHGDDRGIWGRLGEHPSAWSVLDVATPDGARLLAGVRLERRAQPKLTLDTFLVHDLDASVPLDAMFLEREGEDEIVAGQLADVERLAAPFGGRMERPAGPGAYLGRLFDLGVTPLRMEHQSERWRLNQMLQTSMYGGISNSIQTSLRDYLLSNDETLRSHVGRMRENLETCRQTRLAIERAREKHDSIEGIYRAAHEMLKAGVHAVRLRFAELRTLADASRRSHREAQRAFAGAQSAAEAARQAMLGASERLERCTRDLETAEKSLERHTRAHELGRQIADRTSELANARKVEAAAAQTRSEAERACSLARQERDALHAQRADVAARLADLQAAWEDIGRKVGLFREAGRRLADAQTVVPGIGAGHAAEALAHCERAFGEAREVELIANRDLELAQSRRARFDRVLAALTRVSGERVGVPEAADLARRTIDRLGRLEHEAARLEELGKERAEAAGCASAQRDVRERVRALGDIHSAAALHRAFEATGAALTDAKGREIEAAAEQRIAENDAAALALEIAAREADLATHGRARAAARTLAERTRVPVDSAADARTLRDTLRSRLLNAERERERVDAARRDELERVADLEQGGDETADVLQALCDEVGGELLTVGYEDVPVDVAPAVEARLGPLRAALVVDDVPAVAAALVKARRRPDTVWLMESIGAPLPEGEAVGDSLLVPAGDAWRLTRLPERPLVGRAARMREIQRHAAEAARHTQLLEAIEGEVAQTSADLQAAEALVEQAPWLDTPDPAPILAELRARRQSAEGRAREARLGRERSRNEVQALGPRFDALKQALPRAALLDPPDHAEMAERLRKQIEAARRMRDELARVAADAEVLRSSFVDLLHPPPDEDALEALRQRADLAREEMNREGRTGQRLRALLEAEPWFAFADLVPKLEAEESALAGLRTEERAIEASVRNAERAVSACDNARDEAVEEHQNAQGEVTALTSILERLRGELAGTDADSSAAALEEAGRLARESRRLRDEASVGRDEAFRESTETALRAEQAKRDGLTARTKRRDDVRAVRPAWLRWLHLRREVASTLTQVLSAEVARRFDEMGNANASSHAVTQLRLLQERLGRSRDAADVLTSVRAVVGPDAEGDSTRAHVYLQVWRHVRRLLEQMIPRDIVQADDPVDALERLARHLLELNARLRRDEEAFRQRSDTVANSITNRIRKAEADIRRINDALRARARFGSIRGVQINVERIEAMARLLDGLREQLDLFNQAASLEEAMEELYRQVGGGRARGDELLDYRNYLRLTIQVQRQGNDRWETAAPSRLSTGEAIGVGSSVLVVVQEAWERAASLLRGRALNASLRFLFLDEATRLDSDSLSTLIDFCEQMELQLLLAAPAVGRARRGLTYRLVRKHDETGRDVVVARGFRGLLAPA